jgi:peptide chain release factor
MARHWMQITSGRGPEECCRVVARVLERIIAEARVHGLEVEPLDTVPGENRDTLKSALVAIEGENMDTFCRQWEGTILWVCASPFRPKHKRKSWYAGVGHLTPPDPLTFSEQEMRIETMRASGPGGQHVNKTASAVRITHLPTGLTAIAQEERSQHQNRRLALARIAQLLGDREAQKGLETQQRLWDRHNALERGNPVRTFEGPEFRERTA